MHLKKKQVFIVKRGSPAAKAILGKFTKPIRDGQILVVDLATFKSFEEDLIVLEIEKYEE